MLVCVCVTVLYPNPSPECSLKQKGHVLCVSVVCVFSFPCVCVCVFLVQQRSDHGAVGARRGRKHVRGAVETQRGGALRVGGQREGDGRVLVVGVEAQTLASVTHVVCVSGADRVRRAGRAVVVVRARFQLVQRDGVDGRAVHGEGVAGVAGEV